MPPARIIHPLLLLFICWPPIYAHNNDHALNTIKSYMKDSENPCKKFYNYACGNWMTNNGFDEELQIGDVKSGMDYLYHTEVKKILEDGLQHSDKPETKEIFTKLYNFYESCKKENAINVDRYLDIIKPTDEDEWPRDGESWQPKSGWSIWSSMGRLAKYGFNHLFFTFDLELKQDYQTYEAKWEAYELDFAQVMYVQNQKFYTTDNNTIAMLEKVVDFMEKLRKLFYEVKDNSQMWEIMKSFTDTYKGLDLYLLAYIGAEQYENIPMSFTRIGNFLGKLLELIESTPQDVLIHTLKQSFKFYLSQQIPANRTDIECVTTLRNLVPLAVDYVYGQEIYDQQKETTETALEKIFLVLKQKLASIIQMEHSDLPEEEVADFTQKSLNMKLNFGNLPTHVEDRFFTDYFQSWQVVKDDFYLNQLNILKRRYFDARELLKRGEFQPLRKFTGQPLTTPSYLLTSNAVVIPFAYTRHIAGDLNENQLFLFAGIGTHMARAMLHGFNVDGVTYDKNGDLFPRCSVGDIAWTCHTYRRPSKLSTGTDCLRSKYDIDHVWLEEEIADIGGFRVAYESFFQSEEYPKMTPINGSLSDKQLFAIRFAQTFCVNPNFNYEQTQVLPMTRVSHIMESLADFAETFSCPPKSTDNENEVCRVW